MTDRTGLPCFLFTFMYMLRMHRHASQCVVVSAGRVYTILRKEEVRHFKELLRKVNNTFVMDHKLTPQLLEAAQPACAHALEVLQAYLAAEGA